jgi:hypothetical protein
VRYILTYVAPYVGYEGTVIQDVLEAYPNRTTIRTFDVAETATGHDRAALIDKFGDKSGDRSGDTPGTAGAGRRTSTATPEDQRVVRIGERAIKAHADLSSDPMRLRTVRHYRSAKVIAFWSARESDHGRVLDAAAAAEDAALTRGKQTSSSG